MAGSWTKRLRRSTQWRMLLMAAIGSD
ncbi:hypothetical protein GA0115240_14077, partial [Streptomyces sp. DvalAA-14]